MIDDDWPFADPKNVAVFTVRQVVDDGHPVLRVCHDSDDGAWQFLEWDSPNEDDAVLVALEEMVRRDPTLRELADLPLGWTATRRTKGDPWSRRPNPSE